MALAPQQTSRRLVLVRHGETVGQSSIRYYGRTDVPLSTVGRQQMKRVRAALAAEAFDAVYTSTLQRTIAAASLIAPGLEPHRLAGFDEVDFGRWEGLTGEEIAARDPELFQGWRAAPADFVYPGGDSVAAFRARVTQTLHGLLPMMPARVLLVTHRGVIATILAELLHLSPVERLAWPIDIASIHVLVAEEEGWQAVAVNQACNVDRRG